MIRGAFSRKLLAELPDLVAQGVIDAEAAERLRAHYAEARGGTRLLLAVFAVLAALLIGGGVILLVAHNWEHLSRFARAALSLTPLALAALAAAGAAFMGRWSLPWREGTGIAWILSLAAGIALVSQTYHLGGTLHDFLHGWVLLSLPILYLTGSVGALALWLGALVSWRLYGVSSSWEIWQGWLLFLAALPPALLLFRQNRYGPRAALAGWALGVAVAFFALNEGIEAMRGEAAVYLLSFAAVLYLAGRFWFNDAPSAATRPFHVIGALGLAAGLLTFSFADAWVFLSVAELGRLLGRAHYPVVLRWLPLAGAAALLAASLLLRRDVWALLFGAVPILVWILRFSESPYLGMVVVNLYTAGAGVLLILRGAREKKLGEMNAGLALAALLILLRFFDSELSLVARAVGFMAVGAAFLAANLWLSRRIREEKA